MRIALKILAVLILGSVLGLAATMLSLSMRMAGRIEDGPWKTNLTSGSAQSTLKKDQAQLANALAPLGGNPLCANVAITRAFYDPEDDREFAIQVVDAGWKGDGPRRSRSPHTALRCRRCCRPIAGRGNRGLRWWDRPR